MQVADESAGAFPVEFITASDAVPEGVRIQYKSGYTQPDSEEQLLFVWQ
ncbi:hypothetical protein [Gulosibacter sp. 10]|nr:hypothetical protein [Gulosibacter sp. 10]SJM51583.1 hypothetical protein FM112_02040 [Gulosibacter sp. 10]